MTGLQQSNHGLDALIKEAGCSHAGLARRVNELGRVHGLTLRYDKTSVARWLHGQQPRGLVPSLLAEAIGRQLARLVTVDDLGMAHPELSAAHVGLEFPGSTAKSVEIAAELWRSDVHRREFLLSSAFGTTALIAPSRDWLVSPPEETVGHTGGTLVGWSDVGAVRATGQLFKGLDDRFGGGHGRTAVVEYLNTDVAPLLRGSYSDEVGRGLFAAVSELTRLAGWMAYDTGLHGLAQRYFVQALRLSQSAGDRAFGGYVLATMSRQATYLGHGQEAVQLARAAQQGAYGWATPRAKAVFCAVEARGHGILGDVPACEAALRRAEGHLGAARPDDDPSWVAFFDDAQLADEFGHCYRDLHLPRQSQRYAEQSLALRSNSYARSRAFCSTVLATAHLEQGDLEQACAVGGDALALAGQLRSLRSAEYIRDFSHRLGRYQQEPLVREFSEKAADLPGAQRTA
ncbi:MAG: hypothetical protein ACRDPK_12155 [Carbonactinosporaceae bacterium]